MTLTSKNPSTTQRRRRIVAVALALPLSLAMTGSALAASGLGAGPVSAELRSAGNDNGNGKSAAAAATPDKAQSKGSESTGSESKAAAAKANGAKADAPAKRDSSSNPDKHGSAAAGPLTSPQPLSNADRNGTGANPGDTCTHSYCSTRDGSASGNGKGDGVAKGKPCAGCVGKADNKNPKGQAPDGSDHNAGYECDRNQGIGKTNPAHTGCTTSSPTTPPVTTTDACPNMPGNQAPGTPCNNGGGNGGGGGGGDFCPDMPGKQPAGTTCEADVKDNGAEKVTICHATGNGYVTISPSKRGVLRGHVGSSHQDGRDIIPPFTYTDRGVTKSFAGQGDQSLLGLGCALPGTTPVTPVTPGTPGKPGTPVPPTCPTSAVMGPVMTGCGAGGGTPVPPTDGLPIGGVTPGQAAANPVPAKPVAVIANGTVTPLQGGRPAAAVAAGTPGTLPFTGTDAALLAAFGALLLIAGGGTLLVARRERGARTA